MAVYILLFNYHRIIESLKSEKTSVNIKSNHQLNTTMNTKPCPKVNYQARRESLISELSSFHIPDETLRYFGFIILDDQALNTLKQGIGRNVFQHLPGNDSQDKKKNKSTTK